MTAPGAARPAGRATPMINGIDKVTGKARFTADLPHADALAGRILRSPHAHARIVRIDTAGARALSGVMAVVTGEDCSQSLGVEPIPTNEYPLARGRIRYRGEAVAAVAAVDEATAAAALDLIHMEVEDLPACYDRAAATAEGCPCWKVFWPQCHTERAFTQRKGFGNSGFPFTSTEYTDPESVDYGKVEIPNALWHESHTFTCFAYPTLTEGDMKQIATGLVKVIKAYG